MERKMNHTRMLTVCAALIAIYVVLKYLSFDLMAVKFSFAPFPVLVAGFLLGPVWGLAVGALGEGIIQMITYGFTATTLLWILPVALRGFLCGLWSKRRGYRPNLLQTVLCVLITGLITTILNTGMLYLDGIVYRYPVAYTAYAIAMRFVSSVVMTAVFCLILPRTLNLLRKAVRL